MGTWLDGENDRIVVFRNGDQLIARGNAGVSWAD